MTSATVPAPRQRRRPLLRAARGPALVRTADAHPVRTQAARLLRAHPIALGATALLALGALAPAAPVRDAVSGNALSGTSLVLPSAYVALSPLARLLDALCLLSPAQHAALGATLLVAWIAWRLTRAARRRRLGARPRAWREARALVLALGALVGTYAAATLAPRPMAALRVDDPALVRVDFHSHTSASHDVPGWFTPARRRAWHEAAGFDLAYVSDHKAVAGALAAMRGNPARAGEGLAVLPALESWWGPVHVVVLGDAARDPALLADEQLERALPAARAAGRLARPPVLLGTIPDRILPLLTPDAHAFGLRAQEVVDGAPRALAQRDREGDALARRAAASGLVPIAATNHHGWGRTALAWNLVRVPGWRALAPAELGQRVEDVLRRGDAGAVRVATRLRPTAAPGGAARALTLAATVPALAWLTARELQPAERGVWLTWAWAPVALGALARRRARLRAALGVRSRGALSPIPAAAAATAVGALAAVAPRLPAVGHAVQQIAQRVPPR